MSRGCHAAPSAPGRAFLAGGVRNQEAGILGTSLVRLAGPFSYLLSADVHVPHGNPTVRGAGDELPGELQVAQRLHPVTADNTHPHLHRCGGHSSPSGGLLSPLVGASRWHLITDSLVWECGLSVNYLVFHSLLERMTESVKRAPLSRPGLRTAGHRCEDASGVLARAASPCQAQDLPAHSETGQRRCASLPGTCAHTCAHTRAPWMPWEAIRCL